MKKILFILFFISLFYGDEQKNVYDITEDFIYKGCRNILADRELYTYTVGYVTGFAIAQKNATIENLRNMSMLRVNGTNLTNNCKEYLLLASKDSYKFITSQALSRFFFALIIETNVIKNNGESFKEYEKNLEKIKKLFKKKDK